MGFGASSIDLVRKLFRRSEFNHAPFIPAAGYSIYTGLGTTGGTFGMDYLSAGSTIFGLQDYTRIEQDLISRYVDYEDMDESPLVSSGFDLYADDASQTDTLTNKSIWVESDDEDIRRDLNHLLDHTLKAEERIWADVRTLVKYGNSFSELVARDREGVLAMNFLPPPTVRRIEMPPEIGKALGRNNNCGDTMGFIYDPKGVFKVSTKEFINSLCDRKEGKMGVSPNADSPNKTTAIFENWEIVHTRLLGKQPNSIYGFGIGEGGRWLYKRLVLLEDSIILHRLTRAPSRYAFYVDVSGIPPQETSAYLSKVRQGIKRQKFINPSTGKMDLRYQPLSPDEDFFLGVRDGKESTRIESLAGPVYDAIEDIKFFENKLFAVLKIPKPFLTYEESTAKTHLSAEDSRFARTIMRIQREVKTGYKKACHVHLAARGIDPTGIDLTVEMTLPSAIFELAQLEIRNAEIELANAFETWAPRTWIMTNVFGWSEDQIEQMRKIKQREEEAGESSEGSAGPRGGGGAIARAAAKRGQRAGGAPEALASSRWDRGKEINVSSLTERIDELRAKNKIFDRRWSQIAGFMKDLQASIPRGRER